MSFFFFLQQMTSSASTVLPAKQVELWGLEKEKGEHDYRLLPIAALGAKNKRVYKDFNRAKDVFD